MKPKILFYTSHKAASMFLYELAGELCAVRGLDYYSINAPKHQFFSKELSRFKSRVLGMVSPDPGGYINDEGIMMWDKKSGCIAPIRRFIGPAKMDHFKI